MVAFTPVAFSAADYGLDITLWNRSLHGIGAVPHFQTLNATGRHLASGALEILLDADDPAVPKLQTPGTRMLVRLDDAHFISGLVAADAGDYESSGGARFALVDDWTLHITRVLAWIRPDGPIAPAALDELGQAVESGTRRAGTVEGQSGVMVWPSRRMPVETAVKWLLSVNLVGRLRLPISILDDQGRGGTVTLPDVGRFASLEETIVPILDAAGLGLSVWLDPQTARVTVDVYETDDYPQTIDADSGIILPGSRYERTGPTASRVIVGGSGEEAARDFAEYRDSAIEDEWGWVGEKFVSATGGTQEWPEGLDEAEQAAKYHRLRTDVTDEAKAESKRPLDEAGAKGLAESRPTAGIAAELMETGSFFYGRRGGKRGFLLGDRLNIAAGAGAPITDRITEVELDVTAAGRVITPTVGGYVDDPARETRDAIARIAAANAHRDRSR